MKNLLLERDFVIYDPMDALQPINPDGTVRFRRNAGERITMSVYGQIGRSDLTGEPTVENMEVFVGDGEISGGLSETFLQELVHEIVEENQ